MTVLLMRLAGPLQAWGSSSKFNRRLTGREPTKSGVVGLVAAALGRRRTEPVADLAALRFGARIDQVGRGIWDFHTAHTEDGKSAYVTQRQYLADAVFLAGLEGDGDLLRELHRALEHPAFPLFLGRRSCPPTERLSLGLREGGLVQALTDEPWQAAAWYRRRAPETVYLELVHDADGEGAGVFPRGDQPLSFSQERRRYALRAVVADPRGVQKENPEARSRRAGQERAEPATSQDVMAVLEGD